MSRKVGFYVISLVMFGFLIWFANDVYKMQTKNAISITRNATSVSRIIQHLQNYETKINFQIGRLAQTLTMHDKIIESLIKIAELQEGILVDLKNDKFNPSLVKSNLLIGNLTARAIGSGTVIKIKGQKYILTAGHLLDNEGDELVVIIEKGKYIPLEVVKEDKEHDLLLLKAKEVELLAPAVEIANDPPMPGSRIYIVGNPGGIRDMVTTGVIASTTKETNYYLCSAPSFFGNSGGAVYYKNKLVGVVSYVLPLSKVRMLPTGISIVSEQFVGVVNLWTIKMFLADV